MGLVKHLTALVLLSFSWKASSTAVPFSNWKSSIQSDFESALSGGAPGWLQKRTPGGVSALFGISSANQSDRVSGLHMHRHQLERKVRLQSPAT